MIEYIFGQGEKRILTGRWLFIKKVISIIISCYVFLSVLIYPEPILHRSLVFSGIFSVIFITYSSPGYKGRMVVPWYDILLSFSSILIGFYIFLNIDRLVERYPFVGPVYLADYIFFIMTIFILLEGTRRIIGPWLSFLSIGSLMYVFLGEAIPGRFGHMGFSFKNIVDGLFLTGDGIWGSSLGIASTHIVIFIMFGSFLLETGAGDFLFNLVSRVSGSGRGGVAKIAIFTSAMFGMISGSAIANASTTGIMTIPIMKKNGYPSEFSAAVESCASVGGCFMPPIMGSVAFMMSEVVGIPYHHIAVIAFLPALIYFTALFFVVDARSAKIGLKGLDKDKSIRVFSILKKGSGFFFPLTLLIIRLMNGITPSRVGLEVIGVTIIIGLLSKENKLTFKKISKALVKGIDKSLMIVSTMATCGILIGIIHTTGIASKISSLLVSLVSYSSIITLLMVMLIAIFLGLAMNITSSYLLTAVMCAPVLIRFGYEPVSVHMFILFFSAMATITPPVALTSFAAASIADAPPMKVGFLSMKTGLVAYILPFVFVFKPAILLVGPWQEIIFVFVTAVLGVKILALGTERWFLGRKIGILQGVLLSILGIIIILGNLTFIIISIILTGVLATYIKYNKSNDSVKLEVNDEI